MTYAIVRRANLTPAAPKFTQDRPNTKRIFTNTQLIERFDAFLQACRKSPHTRINYIDAAKQFARFLGEKTFTSATTADVRGYLGQLYARNLAGSTMASRLHGLRSLFKFLELGGQVLTSAPRYIQTRKLPKRLPHAKSEEEIERLIDAAETPRDRAVLELLYASGLRVSELAHLRVEDVNLRARSLIVRQGKGDKDRIGLFGRKAAEALATYLGDRRSGPLFVPDWPKPRGGITRRHGVWWGMWREVGANGKLAMRNVRLGDYELSTKERARQALETASSPLVSRSIYRIVVQAAKRAGIAGVHPHMLRHSMATHLLNRGVDVRFVQELLGHSTPQATQKYLHVAIDQLKKVHGRCFGRSRA